MFLLLLLHLAASGTHVTNTSEIGAFKVISEGGVASGVRRIEAVAGQAAVEYLQAVDGIVKTLASSLKVKGEDVPARVTALQVGQRRDWLRGCLWRR
jgi:alanyl-tRNA synthetase